MDSISSRNYLHSTFVHNTSVFLAYFALLITRSWHGIGRIPSDPNYTLILDRLLSGQPLLVATRPYLHVDTPWLASITAVFPISTHGLVANVLTHIIWALCSLWIFFTLLRVSSQRSVAFLGGAVLVLCPWAAQSSLGNYGGVRWPILTAGLIFVAMEMLRESPRIWRIFPVSLLVTMVSPVSIVLLVPLSFGLLKPTLRKGVHFLIMASPILVGTAINLMEAGGGYETKVTRFWPDASAFWVSGQLLPSIVAVLGTLLLFVCRRTQDVVGKLSVILFLSAISVAGLTYQLGGIADRYFVTPAALSSIGFVVGVNYTGRFKFGIRSMSWVVLIVLVVIPGARWFSALPWLTSGVVWSEQVNSAKEICSSDYLGGVELNTSSGIVSTPPIPCTLLD